MKNTSEVRSDLNMGVLLFSVETGEPNAVDSTPAVVGSLTDGTYDLAKVGRMQLNVFGINVIVQSTSIAFRNFHHSWVSVLMDHSDPDFGSVITSSETVRDSQDVGGSVGFSRSQNLHYGGNEAFVIWDNGLKTLCISSDFHQVSSLGASFVYLKFNIRVVSS